MPASVEVKGWWPTANVKWPQVHRAVGSSRIINVVPSVAYALDVLILNIIASDLEMLSYSWSFPL